MLRAFLAHLLATPPAEPPPAGGWLSGLRNVLGVGAGSMCQAPEASESDGVKGKGTDDAAAAAAPAK